MIEGIVKRKQAQELEKLKRKERIAEIREMFIKIACDHYDKLSEYFYVEVYDSIDVVISISNYKIDPGFYGNTHNIVFKTYGDLALKVGYGHRDYDTIIKFDSNTNKSKLKILFKECIGKLVSDCYSMHHSKK